MINYPIKFEPILKSKIWGGKKLITNFHKKSSLSDIGESWEISDVENNISVVSNGQLRGKTLKTLLEDHTHHLVGKRNFELFGTNFPLLIKFIDAKEDLSVQVHPNNELSKKRHNSFGKTEMWYIMQADEGAELVLGFNKTLNPEKYKKLLDNKEITSAINYEPIKAGDSFFIETGTVHAIGTGTVLAEIQQTSDITYRIYDWDRVDDEGNSRELHTELAIDALNFSDKIAARRSYSNEENKSNEIVKCEYFTTNFLPVKGKLFKDYTNLDSFVIYMCVQGEVQISINNQHTMLHTGETVLIPACVNGLHLEASQECNLLEVSVS